MMRRCNSREGVKKKSALLVTKIIKVKNKAHVVILNLLVPLLLRKNWALVVTKIIKVINKAHVVILNLLYSRCCTLEFAVP
jgi:hypothetical protein